jgi:predicted nucleic acid-binding protein
MELSNVFSKRFIKDGKAISKIIKETFSYFNVHPISSFTLEFALTHIMPKYKYSFYDSLIIASAIESNCKILYSEDLQHSQKIEGSLIITNPFK